MTVGVGRRVRRSAAMTPPTDVARREMGVDGGVQSYSNDTV